VWVTGVTIWRSTTRRGVLVFQLIEAMGVRVVEVDELEPPIMFVREHRVAFVSRQLDHEDRAWAADWLLHAAASAA